MSTVDVQIKSLVLDSLNRLAQAEVPVARRGTVPPQDATMMYPWSIGTTRAAKERLSGSRRREECPPEVYIG